MIVIIKELSFHSFTFSIHIELADGARTVEKKFARRSVR